MDMKLSPDSKTLSITWHVRDDWYGQNYRVVLVPDETLSFASDADAKRFAAKLAKYVTRKYLKPIKHKATVCGADAKIANYGDLATYRYLPMGPSWSCQNFIVTVNELLNHI
jgi:hypothetical protein